MSRKIPRVSFQDADEDVLATIEILVSDLDLEDQEYLRRALVAIWHYVKSGRLECLYAAGGSLIDLGRRKVEQGHQ